MLSTQQIKHFNTFGFLVLPQLLTTDEILLMKAEAEDIFYEARGNKPFTGDKWEAVQPFFERRPFLSKLPADDRIYGIGLDLCGPDFILSVTEGNLQKGDTPWHGDLAIKSAPFGIKIAFYTDPLTRNTGALRVIPGSHAAGEIDTFHSLRQRTNDPDFMPFGIKPEDIPCYALESQPGDVVVFTESTLHSSFGGASGRHQHAINFISKPQNNEELNVIRRHYEGRKFGLRPSESYVHSNNTRIRSMVSKLVEWGFDQTPI